MDQDIFFKIVKEKLYTYFSKKGFSKCKIYKGRRSAISFIKDTGTYQIPIDIQWQGKINGEYMFAVYFVNIWIYEDDTKPNLNWIFTCEEELKKKLILLQEKSERENFISKCEERAATYFIINE
jgi:hypothetical protein